MNLQKAWWKKLLLLTVLLFGTLEGCNAFLSNFLRLNIANQCRSTDHQKFTISKRMLDAISLWPFPSTALRVSMVISYWQQDNLIKAETYANALDWGKLRLSDQRWLAMVLNDAGDWQTAIRIYQNIYQQLPLQTRRMRIGRQILSALNDVAFRASASGERKFTETAYMYVLSVNPGNLIAAYGLMGSSYLTDQNSDRSLSDLMRHYRFDPEYDDSILLQRILNDLVYRGIWTEKEADFVQSTLEDGNRLYHPACYWCGILCEFTSSLSGLEIGSKPYERQTTELMSDITKLIPACSTMVGHGLAVNLLEDGGFEKSTPENWIGWSWYTHERTVSNNAVYTDGFYFAELDDRAYSGKYAGRITGFWLADEPDRSRANAALLHGPIQVKAGQVYFLSFVYRTTSLSPQAQLVVLLPQNQLVLPPTDQWMRVNIVIPITNRDIQYDSRYLYGAISLTGTGHVWMDEAELHDITANKCMADIHQPLMNIAPTQ